MKCVLLGPTAQVVIIALIVHIGRHPVKAAPLLMTAKIVRNCLSKQKDPKIIIVLVKAYITLLVNGKQPKREKIFDYWLS